MEGSLTGASSSSELAESLSISLLTVASDISLVDCGVEGSIGARVGVRADESDSASRCSFTRALGIPHDWRLIAGGCSALAGQWGVRDISRVFFHRGGGVNGAMRDDQTSALTKPILSVEFLFRSQLTRSIRDL